MVVVHTAIWVSDLEASTEFYENVLGLDYQMEYTNDEVVNYYVGTEEGADIQFKYDPDADEDVTPAGIDHLALSVDDVEATFVRVVDDSDCTVVMEPTDFEAVNRRVAFVTDPDGYVVEFVERLDAS